MDEMTFRLARLQFHERLDHANRLRALGCRFKASRRRMRREQQSHVACRRPEAEAY